MQFARAPLVGKQAGGVLAADAPEAYQIASIPEEVTMATLIVRQVEEGIVEELKERARRAGRSAEAEHRLILQDALGRRRLTGAEFVRAVRRGRPAITEEEAETIGRGSRDVLDGTRGLEADTEERT